MLQNLGNQSCLRLFYSFFTPFANKINTKVTHIKWHIIESIRFFLPIVVVAVFASFLLVRLLYSNVLDLFVLTFFGCLHTIDLNRNGMTMGSRTSRNGLCLVSGGKMNLANLVQEKGPKWHLQWSHGMNDFRTFPMYLLLVLSIIQWST